MSCHLLSLHLGLADLNTTLAIIAAILQRTATHCNALQHTATHCNILLPTFLIVSQPQGSEHDTHGKCSTLQHTAKHYSTLQHALTHCNTLQHTATHRNVLLPFLDATRPRRSQRDSPGNCSDTATHCTKPQHTATHCNTLQHTATHCNTLQHTATQCTILSPIFLLPACESQFGRC